MLVKPKVRLEDLTLRDEASELLRLALPIIGMTVSRMLMGFIDVAMVSVLGTEALAAVSPAAGFMFILAGFGMGIAAAVQTFVSQCDGRGRPQESGGYLWQTLYVAVLFGLVAAPAALSVGWWFEPVRVVAKLPEPVAALEIAYLEYALWSLPFMVLCAGLNSFFNGIQKPGLALYAVVASLVVNGVGNYLLIFGKFGCPEMGIAGAGLATTLGWAIRAVIMAAFVYLPEVAGPFGIHGSWRFDARRMRGILRVGLPTALQWMTDIGATVAFTAIIMPHYGAEAMAASNVAMQYMHLAFMPAIGIGMALTSLVGYLIGAGRADLAARKTRIGMLLTGCYMSAVGVFMVSASGWLIRWFSDDPAVIAAGRWILIWAAVLQVFDAMCITYMGALRGAGDTRVPAIITATAMWTVFIGGALLLAYLLPAWGYNAPWIAFVLGVTTLGLSLRYRWRSGGWRSIRLFDGDGESPASAVEPPAEPQPDDTELERAPAGAT